jgi:hypothetical protein
MCLTRRRRYAIDARAPAAAREYLHAAAVSALRPRGWSVADDLALIASELVTDAFIAGGRQLLLTVEFHVDFVELVGRDDRPMDAPHAQVNETRRRLLDALTLWWQLGEETESAVWRARVKCDPEATEGIACRFRVPVH